MPWRPRRALSCLTVANTPLAAALPYGKLARRRALADAKIIAQSGPLLSNRSVASFAAGSTRRAFERPLTVYVRPHGVDRMATGPKGRKRPAAAVGNAVH